MTLLPLSEIGTRECEPWRNKLFRRFNDTRPQVEKHYRWLATTRDHVTANRWLSQAATDIKLGNTGLSCDCDSEQIDSYAEAKSKACQLLIHDAYRRLGDEGMLRLMQRKVARTGIDFPIDIDKENNKDDKVGALARIVDRQWWVRKLRTWQKKKLESFTRELGLVSAKTGIYASDITVRRHLSQKIKTEKLLESLEAENDQGQCFTIAELAKLSVSNPEIRRTEMMVRMRGFEELAEQAEEAHTGNFYTLTCPSKYHARSKSGRLNPKFNGSSPIDAQTYLNKVWQLTRAAWARETIHPFGMRVAEPHHDGTPHWHLLLFFPTEHAKRATEIFKHYALAEDGNEAGATKRRLCTEIIDSTKGSATGYIAAYSAPT